MTDNPRPPTRTKVSRVYYVGVASPSQRVADERRGLSLLRHSVGPGTYSIARSEILKVARAPRPSSATSYLPGDRDSDSPNHWKREAEHFRDGLLGWDDDLVGQLC